MKNSSIKTSPVKQMESQIGEQPATCKCVSIYSDALTRGLKYKVIEIDDEKQQVRIRGDNNRTRWFPFYCFDLTGADVPEIESIWIEAEELPPDEWNPLTGDTDVTVKLTDGTFWVASFFTYQRIRTIVADFKISGECLHGKYFWVSDMILVDEVSRERIEEVVKHLLSENVFQEVFRRCDEGEEVPK